MRLKQLRKNANMTQTALAIELKVAQNTLSNWENGNRLMDSETAARVAHYFNVSIDYLLGNTDIKEKPTPGNGDELTVEQQELLDLLKDLPDADFAKVQEYVQLLKLKRNS